jgi:hypothetical protein
MRFDWQTIAVVLIVFGATAYVARRAYERVRSFRARQKIGDNLISIGCSGCENHISDPVHASVPKTRTIFVELTRSSAPRASSSSKTRS